MTTNTFKNASGGLWSIAGNWSSGSVPASTDDAVIALASGATVELPSGLGNSGTTGGSSIYALNSVTISGGRLLVDAGEFLNLGSLSAPSAVGATAGLDIKGAVTFSRSSASIAGAVTVESGGTLNLGSPNTPTTAATILAPGATISLAKGGAINVNQNVSSAALTAFAGQITPSGQAAGTAPVGSLVSYAGNITNAGSTLNLTAGGPLAAITSLNASNQTEVIGGTILNSGKFSVPLAIPNLVNVALKGAFTVEPALGGLYVSVTDGLTVQNLDGSAGLLELATASTDLETGSSTSNPVVLNGMTIDAGPGIDAGSTLILGPSTTTNFATMSGHIGGVVIDQGVLNLAGASITVTLGLPSGNSTPGSFENDGTINVGAGDTLVAGASFLNKGTLTVAAGGTAVFAGGAAGTIALTGTGDTLSFGPSGAGVAAISGFRAGDVITAGVGNNTAATLAFTGQTLTIQQAGTTLATLALSDAGQAYAASDFGITTAANGTVTLTTTHAAGTSGAGGASGGGSTGGTGGGSVIVSGSGNNVTIAAGTTATTGPGGNHVTVSSTGTVISNGPDTVMGGTGATTVTLNGSGATVIGGGGPLMVFGGPGNNTVFAGTGGLAYAGGAGLDTVVGGGKPVVATAGGGSGGAEFFGGGNATFTAGAGTGLNLEVGGNGDQLYAAGANGVLFGTVGGDMLMSSVNDTGSSVFFGAGGSGHMTFITGAGSDILALGQGTNTVTLGSGHDVIFANGGNTSTTTIQAGAGSLDLAFSGASTVLDIAAGMARAFNLYAFVPGADTIHLQGFSANEAANAIATQRSVAGGTQLSLGDGSVVSLIGVSHANANLFS